MEILFYPTPLSFSMPAVFSQGVVIAIVGYCTVFSALVILYFVFTYLSKILNLEIRNRLRREGKEECAEVKDLQISGDESAAISMAIYLFHELHDVESNVITIKKIERVYSPWSSKVYNFRRYPK